MEGLQKALIAQERWKPLSPLAKKAKTLVQLEFQDLRKAKELRNQRLQRFLAFCKKQVPFYQGLSEALLNAPTTLDHLQDYPLLSKEALRNQREGLISQSLPEGHSITGYIQSSGTTGMPVKVLQTNWSTMAFSLLKQREYRWFGIDPRGTLGILRLPTQLPKDINDQPLGLGSTLKGKGWPNVGKHFETGPFLAYSVFNDVEEQAKWLTRMDPEYLLAYSETLEHLAFAFDGAFPGEKLKALQVISETLTPDMRERIGRVFNRPLHQNYGLNELGLVASKCPEGGRYHVHSEFYEVEIIKEDGSKAQPGEQGKIVVSGLGFLGMPLLRYDTDDLAIATDQNCPCGRTLPCFGEVVGRYSRIAHLPKGTLEKVGVLRRAITECPQPLLAPLRRFQVEQKSEKQFVLRLLALEPLPKEVGSYFLSLWNKEAPGDELQVIQVKDLQAGPNGKFQDFISCFFPSIQMRNRE